MRTFLLTTTIVLIAALHSHAQLVERDLTHFDKIRVTNEVNVYMTRGEQEHARISATGLEPESVVTDITGKTLEITLPRGTHKDATVEVYITYRELREISVGQSGYVSIQDTVVGDKLSITAGLNSRVTADVELNTMDINLSKGATAMVKGTVGSYEANLSSGSTLAALYLISESVYLRITSRSVAKVNAKNLLDANIRSWSSLTYTGQPEKKKIKTGLGASILSQ